LLPIRVATKGKIIYFTLTIMSMQAYLAQKYMTGPKADAILARAAPKKKKKRKAESSTPAAGSGSAMIVDADGGWGDEGKDDVGDDDVAEAVVEKDRGFKKRRVEGGSNWETIQPGIKEESPPADEQPTVVEDTSSTPFLGGLLTSDQLRKALPRSKGKTEATQEVKVWCRGRTRRRSGRSWRSRRRKALLAMLMIKN
jgi:pre-mRNA-splicing factor CWC26